MTSPFRIGIAGLGTVGSHAIKILNKNKDLITARAGRPIEIVAVSARHRDADRDVDVSAYDWVDNPRALADRDDIDAVAELMGGSDGPAYDLTNAALSGGKHVITANKALLAHHGLELAALADKQHLGLAYEAAVGGVIPIIKTLQDSFTSNQIKSIYGILNGTCNYILTRMRETGQDFEIILKEAQDKGYAEADPGFDVDGVDTAHKICLLGSLAFGVEPNFDELAQTGIRHITSNDIKLSEDLGYRIKLLGISKNIDGQILQYVEPCLVPADSPIAVIDDVYNAVFVEGDFMETPVLSGHGAGGGPTASAVVSDIINLARGEIRPVFGVPARDLAKPDWALRKKLKGRYYLRLEVEDRPGVIADVSAILRDHNVSIETVLQHGRAPGGTVSVVILTHETPHQDMLDSATLIGRLDVCHVTPKLMRIEDI